MAIAEDKKKTDTNSAKKTTAKSTSVKSKTTKAVTKSKSSSKKTDTKTTKARSTVKKAPQTSDNGIANAMLKDQVKNKVTDINNKVKTDSKAKIEIVTNNEDATITIIEEHKKQTKNANDTFQKKEVPKKSGDYINVTAKDLTVTVQTNCSMSIKDTDKELAQQMLESHQVLSSRFQLEDIIGVGGMGIVYRATDIIRQDVKKNDCSVAIKVLSQDVKKHKQALLALQREAYKEQELSHPNVVKVYDFNRDGDVVYKVMELVSGIHLKDWLKEQRNLGKVDYKSEEYINKVVKIINEVAKGLEYVHGQNIVHSDLKPSNIFVTDKGEIKIFDFGIARTIKTKNFNQKYEDESIFDPTTFAAFTPKYASYEMLTRQEPSASDDVYALGCIMYEMLGGHHPYDGKNAKDAIEKEMIAEDLSYLPLYLQELVMSMLELKREDRISNMTEVLSQLNTQYLPSIGVQQKQTNSEYSVEANSLLLNKPFIFTISILLATCNIYALAKWFSPKTIANTQYIDQPATISDAVSKNITSDYSTSRKVISAIPGCESLLSKGAVTDGSSCLLSLETDSGSLYRVNMLVFNSPKGPYAISKDPLNNITVSSLGEDLTDKEKSQPLAIHTFTKDNLQTFYIRTVSLYGGMGLASYDELLNLVSRDVDNLCSKSRNTYNNITLMGSGYGEVTVDNGTSFKVVSVVNDKDKCKINTTSLVDTKDEKLITRLIWRSTTVR